MSETHINLLLERVETRINILLDKMETHINILLNKLESDNITVEDSIDISLSNKGKKWTTDKENELIDQLKSGKNFTEIATLFGRTCGAIEYKFRNILREKNEYDIDYIIKTYNLHDEKDINKMKKCQWRQ